MTAPDKATETHNDEIRIGISACLLGEEVRYDGGHKRDAFLVGTLQPFVTFVPVCPEFEAGLGVPRPSLRLVRTKDDIRVIEPKTGIDRTDVLRQWAKARIAGLLALNLDGFVLKKDSPSCGMERVKTYDEKSVPARDGRGIFAAALMDASPLLPVEEEGRLHDPLLRENFLTRVFAGRRLRALFASPPKLSELVRFHSAEKLLLMAHQPAAYQSLGRLVATAKGRPSAELRDAYRSQFMAALGTPATRRRQVNVLQHVAGYFKELITKDERDELHGLIAEYGRGLLPLIVPITLARHFVRRHAIAWLAIQTYLAPHPRELMLLNHV